MAAFATELSPIKWPNPTEAAIRWVDLADKACKAWTDACLQIVTTFSTAARTQADVFASLKTPVMPTPESVIEAIMAPVEAAIEAAPVTLETVAEVVGAVPEAIEAVAAPVEVVPAPAEVAPVLETAIEATPPIAKPAPAAKAASVAKAPPAAKIAAAAKPAKPTAK